MAFYNDKMVKNTNLMTAWRAGHNIQVEEDVSLVEICEEIESHLRRHRHPCSRLSLRTASELLAGASRLHLDGVDRLMHDAFKLAYGPKPGLPADLPISRADNIYSGSSGYGYEVNSSSSSEAAVSDEMSSDDDDGEESSVSSHDEVYNCSVPSPPQKKNQAVQTENMQEDLDPNLPFGQFLIFNSPASRYPSMLMFSSLNEKVKNIISLLSDKN